jgi:hypothetical protein
MEQPFVSCLCLTYNRPPLQLGLLEEAVHSYLLQSYLGNKELLILNDTPGQILTVNDHLRAAGVCVVNLPRRFRTLGEKYAAAHGLARGNIFLWWDDDDISLPWRVPRSVSILLADSADYWSYIYRWGVSLAHVSGHSGLAGGYDLRGREEVVPGEYAIQPRWKQDYEDLVRAALWRIAQVKPAPATSP